MDAQKYIHDRMDAAGTYLLPSVRQLGAQESPDGRLKAAGSVVLMWYRGKRFLLSAAHCVEAFAADHGLFVGTQTKWVQIDGPFRVPMPPPGGRSKDIYDFAFREVTEAFSAQLDGCTFLTARQVALSDTPKFDGFDRSKYLALGFPQNRLRYDVGSRTTFPKSMVFTGAIASEGEHTTLGLHPRSHVVLEYDADAVWSRDGLKQSPSVTGLSGGGMFRMRSIEHIGDVSPPELAAISIEHRKRHKVMIGVRIGVICSAIDRDVEQGAA